MDNQKFINECLFALFNAATCGDSDARFEICDKVNLKRLRRVLKENGVTFDSFSKNSNLYRSGHTNFTPEKFAKLSVSENKTAKEYMSEHWFPFSNAEIKTVQVEVDKLNKELEHPQYTKVKDFDKAKNRGDGIEKIFVLLKVLANDNLIELVDGSWAKTINKKVDINEIFEDYVPDIDTGIGWYQTKDCGKILPKLYKAALDSMENFDAKVIKFLVTTNRIKMFVDNGNLE